MASLALPCLANTLPRGPSSSHLMHQQRLLALCRSPPCSASFTSRLTAAAGSSSGPAGARRPSVTHPDLLEISTVVTLALLHFCIGSQLQDHSALYSSKLYSSTWNIVGGSLHSTHWHNYCLVGTTKWANSRATESTYDPLIRTDLQPIQSSICTYIQ